MPLSVCRLHNAVRAFYQQQTLRGHHSQSDREDCLQLTRSATRDDGELRDRSALVPGVSNNTKLVLPGPLSPRLHTVRAKTTFVPPLIPPGQRSILRPPQPGRTRGCSGGLGTAGS